MSACGFASRRAFCAPKSLASRTPARQKCNVSAACYGADHGRLVGVKAPDFEAEAVFDQEFVDVSLAQYQCASSFC